MLRALAYVHPAWMVLGVGLAALALRTGLALRRARIRRVRRPAEARGKHLRLAKPAVVLLLIGFVGGPVSAVWLRDWDPFTSFHAWIGLLAAGLFTAAAVLGRRLEKHRTRSYDVHAVLGGLAVLAAAVAAVAGFILLP